MTTFFSLSDTRWRALLEPRRFLRWIYVARLSVAAAIFIAAVWWWPLAVFETTLAQKTLIATLSFIGAFGFTSASFFWSDIQRRPISEAFLYSQCIVDLLLVTAVVHLTGGERSGFAALYILVNAGAALLFPIGGALLIALLGIVIYLADAISFTDGQLAFDFWLQLVVFSAVAIITAYISARLREAGQGTERLAAELKSVRLREKDILDNIRSGILTVDDAGGLLFANPIAEELTGVPLSTRIGEPIIDVLRTAMPALADALTAAIASRTITSRSEGLVVRADETFPVGITTTSSEGDGDNAWRTTTAIFNDISDQKRLELLRLRAQRLEAVAELSASLAHEIKNPLASIRSAVEQMSRRPAANDDERTLGGLIVRESDRLSRLLSEFLDFARVRVTRRDAVDLNAVVRTAAAVASQHPDCAAGATVHVDFPPHLPPMQGDEDLLHQAFFNLILNALQATAPGTVVQVKGMVATAAQLPSGVAFPAGALGVAIQYRGSGIPAEVQARLFEPFTTTKPGGTGLGLAITHRSVEAHAGLVLVDSTPLGTRFTVYLPIATDTGVSP